MPFQSRKINLYYTEGTSDKEYRVECVKMATPHDSRFEVFISYGRRGRLGAQRRVSSVGGLRLGDAENLYFSKVQAKVDKGYTPETHGTPYSAPSWSRYELTIHSSSGVSEHIAVKMKKDLLPCIHSKLMNVDALLDLLEEAPRTIQTIPSRNLYGFWVTDSQAYQLNFQTDKVIMVESEAVRDQLTSLVPNTVFLAIYDEELANLNVLDSASVVGEAKSRGAKGLNKRLSDFMLSVDPSELLFSVNLNHEGDDCFQVVSAMTSMIDKGLDNSLAVVRDDNCDFTDPLFLVELYFESGGDTGNVTALEGLFKHVTSFNQDISLS